jgi:hypothetical protein
MILAGSMESMPVTPSRELEEVSDVIKRHLGYSPPFCRLGLRWLTVDGNSADRAQPRKRCVAHRVMILAGSMESMPVTRLGSRKTSRELEEVSDVIKRHLGYSPPFCRLGLRWLTVDKMVVSTPNVS